MIADFLKAVKAAGSADEISRVAREYMRAAAEAPEAQARRAAATPSAPMTLTYEIVRVG